MPEGPARIFGGLPVIAEVSFWRDYYGECDASVDRLFWQKRDGSKGKEVSQKIYDRLDRIDYWECDVIEQVSDYLAYEEYEREHSEHSKVSLASQAPEVPTLA